LIRNRYPARKTVLITGAAGDIGCEIVWQVLAFALKIIMVDQAETPLHHLILQVKSSHKFTDSRC
jgi:FlaA1/EpsC-like NDP-sugar epimerase